MKLHYEVVAHIAKLLQLTILTGTDIVDHLHKLELEEKDGQLWLTKETRDESLDNIDKLLEEVDVLLNDTTASEIEN